MLCIFKVMADATVWFHETTPSNQALRERDAERGDARYNWCKWGFSFNDVIFYWVLWDIEAREQTFARSSCSVSSCNLGFCILVQLVFHYWSFLQMIYPSQMLWLTVMVMLHVGFHCLTVSSQTCSWNIFVFIQMLFIQSDFSLVTLL